MAMGTDPIADLLTLQRDVDRVVERFGAQVRRAEGDGERRSFWTPSIDAFKQGEDFVVQAEVPGVDPSDIGVSVTGNMLTVKGERKRQQQVREGDWVLHESRVGTFERRVTLPQDIDAAQVRAQYRAGVLEVTIPRSALISPQARDVAVTGPRQAATGQQQQGPEQPAQQGYQGAQQPASGQYQQQPGQPYETGYPAGQTPRNESGAGQGAVPPRVGVEGGWVRSEDSSASADEGRPRSARGSWLHGSGQ